MGYQAPDWNVSYGRKDLDEDGKIKSGRFGEGTFPNSKQYWKAFRKDPIYATTAAKIGVNLNSQNDVRKIAEYIANGGGNSKKDKDKKDDKKKSDRDSGKYQDIIDNLGNEVNAANKKADDYANKAAKDIEDFNARVGTLDTNYANSLADLTVGFNNQIASMQSDFNSRYSGLQDLMVQQQMAHQSAQALMTQQVQAAENAFNNQVRIGDNLSRAYVPAAETSAATAAMGDNRQTGQQQTQRRTEDNTLSALSIVSGLGTNANPLAGMQLA